MADFDIKVLLAEAKDDPRFQKSLQMVCEWAPQPYQMIR